MNHNTPSRRRIKTSPDAVVVFGHCAVSGLHDPAVPVLCDPRDLRQAGELSRIDTRCGSCTSETLVSHDPAAVLIITGHQPDCPWWETAYADAYRRDGAAIDELAASLAGEAAAS